MTSLVLALVEERVITSDLAIDGPVSALHQVSHDPSLRHLITMKDGRTLSSQVDFPKGSIENAMSDAEIRAKFENLAQPVAGRARAGQIASLVNDLERCAAGDE